MVHCRQAASPSSSNIGKSITHSGAHLLSRSDQGLYPLSGAVRPSRRQHFLVVGTEENHIAILRGSTIRMASMISALRNFATGLLIPSDLSRVR